MKPLVQCLQDDLEKVIDKYRDEGVTFCEVIGALEILKLDVWRECPDENEKDEEE